MVVYDLDCHTYDINGSWKHCMNCGSAIEYSCVGCNWSYTHGLNPRNPRAGTNDANKPKWLRGVSPTGPDGNARAVHGVPFILDDIPVFEDD